MASVGARLFPTAKTEICSYTFPSIKTLSFVKHRRTGNSKSTSLNEGRTQSLLC